ncbi:Kv channel-interacting protein 1-like isoform X2 [Artemia franciscana]|uniref:Kv channel-interacting protein 1-like isoform X2 n=1 Tax=Artemia franciscana TaxID=6661 RepID=UPI0032DADEFC
MELRTRQNVTDEVLLAKSSQPGLTTRSSSLTPTSQSVIREEKFTCHSFRHGLQTAWKKLKQHKRKDATQKRKPKKPYEQLDIEVEDIENPVYRRPRGLEQLAKATHFSKKELKRLYRDFKAAYPSGVIKEENFKAGYTQLFPKGASSSLYFRYVFNTFDKDSTGIVGFEDLVFVLSKLCRGSLEDKLRWTFRLYDTNNDNTISQQEMEDVISSVAFLTGLYDEEDIERRIKLWVESIFEKMDLNKDGVIDQDEFLSCCLQDENIHHSLTVFDDFIEDITI